MFYTVTIPTCFHVYCKDDNECYNWKRRVEILIRECNDA